LFKEKRVKDEYDQTIQSKNINIQNYLFRIYWI